MIKILSARYLGNFKVMLEFSDGAEGEFDGHALLAHSGPLLTPLRDEAYFSRHFLDAGALCWPNGLDLSPSRLREQVRAIETA